MISLIEYLNLPTRIAIAVIFLFFVMQLIGEVLEFKGKVAPEIMNVRKHYLKKKKEREDITQALADVKKLLGEVNLHYSSDNISKRDDWMHWVNDRAQVYDDSIETISSALASVTEALRDNSKITEELFIQSSRDRIIDFATKVENPDIVVSREEFNRIFKVYDRYEEFLKERGLKNGEIDINYQIAREAYEEHLRNHTFIEDIRGYEK